MLDLSSRTFSNILKFDQHQTYKKFLPLIEISSTSTSIVLLHLTEIRVYPAHTRTPVRDTLPLIQGIEGGINGGGN